MRSRPSVSPLARAAIPAASARPSVWRSECRDVIASRWTITIATPHADPYDTTNAPTPWLTEPDATATVVTHSTATAQLTAIITRLPIIAISRLGTKMSGR